MRLKILGSGSIIPTPRRFASGLLLEMSGRRILMDPGPGVMEKLRRDSIPPQSLDLVLITHFHMDHVADFLPIVMSRAYGVDGRPAVKPVTLKVAGPKGLEKLYRRLVVETEEFNYLSRVMRCLEYVTITEMDDGAILSDGGLVIKVAEVEHFNGIAYRVEGEGLSITYSGDTVPDERLVRLASGCDILLHECSFPHEELLGKHTSETQLADIAYKTKPKLVVATHLYPVWEGLEERIVRAVQAKGAAIRVAYDMMEIIEI